MTSCNPEKSELLVCLKLFAGQPIPKKKYIGMFVSLAGVALISIGTGFNGEMSVSTEGFLLAALSARAALYFGNYEEAEKSASLVISEGFHDLYHITSLNAAQQKEAQ